MSSPMASAATLVGLAAAVQVPSVPTLPPLSGDPEVVLVVDVLRVVLLIVGLSLAGLTARHAFILPRTADAALFVAGFRWRSAALIVGLLYVSLAAYDRLGQPVTAQFVLTVLFVLFAGKAIHVATRLPRPELEAERLLREHRHVREP